MARVLDIFCGAGGSSAGACAAGFEIAGGIDMWSRATETYAANFPKAHVVTNRLENVELTNLKSHVGDIDLLLASPECTSHSCAKGAAPRSEESRATAMQAVAYAKAFKPRWIVLENVIYMRPWSRYKALTAQLKTLGYNVAEQFLKASDFGVPQARRRLFIVADRDKVPLLVNAKQPERQPAAASVLDPGWYLENLSSVPEAPRIRNARARSAWVRVARGRKQFSRRLLRHGRRGRVAAAPSPLEDRDHRRSIRPRRARRRRPDNADATGVGTEAGDGPAREF